MTNSDRLYTIGEVSTMLGLPSPTIRSWERRYGLPVGERTEAGHRRYRSSDVSTLARMQVELATGRAVAEAAAIITSSLTTTPAILVDDLCEAARQFDAVAILASLDRARLLHGLTTAIELVLFPAMRELGHRWETAEGGIAHEHVATAAVQSWLRTAQQSAPPPLVRDPVLLACGPEEQHTLALDAFGVLLAHAGVHCLLLGGRVPAVSLVDAVHGSRARAVVLTCQFDHNRPAAVAALQAVADTLATPYYAGAAFTDPASRQGVPGYHLGDDLSRAAERVADIRS